MDEVSEEDGYITIRLTHDRFKELGLYISVFYEYDEHGNPVKISSLLRKSND